MGCSGDIRDPSHRSGLLRFQRSELPSNVRWPQRLVSRRLFCTVRRRREVRILRSFDAFLYPESQYIWVCISPRPFPLIGTAGMERIGLHRRMLQWFSRSTACLTSTSPHDWCAWRAVNGFPTARPNNGWAAGERVRRCSTLTSIPPLTMPTKNAFHLKMTLKFFYGHNGVPAIR